MKTKIELYIEELKQNDCYIYRKDGENMSEILLNLKNGNYDIASKIYSNMDTNVRDNFLEKMTNNFEDEETMKELSKKLKFEWLRKNKTNINIENNQQDAIIGELLTQEKYKFVSDKLIGEIARDIFKLLGAGFK